MFIKKDEIKSAIKRLIDGHGQIHKLWTENSEVIGYVVRYEKSNDVNEATVVFNVSLNEHYCNEKPTSFFPKSVFKYFAIKHAENFNTEKNKDKMFILNTGDNEINGIMLAQIDNMLKNYFLNDCIDNYDQLFGGDKLTPTLIYGRTLQNIIHVMNYYKNKKVKIFLDLN